jgi:O-antigen/teichoic acid export membrane protein
LAGAGYASLIFAGAYLLYLFDMLSAMSAFGLMGAASLAAAGWLVWKLKLKVVRSTKSEFHDTIRKDHWGYGRWVFGAAALTWFPLNVYFLILPIWGGLEATGAFRALYNLLLPIIHLNTAFCPILVPALVTVRRSSAFRKRTLEAAVVFLGGGALYWAFLAQFNQPVVSWLYNGQYDAFAPVLSWLGVTSVFLSLTTVAEAALRGVERPDRAFWSYAFSGAVGLATGLLLIPKFRVVGASLGLVLSSITAATVMSWHVWNLVSPAQRKVERNGS